MMLQSSEFKETITIKEMSFTKDNIGQEVETLKSVLTCKAKINGISGKEYFTARALNSENDLTFEVRYCNALSTLIPQKTIIEYNSKTYDVKQIDDYMQSHITLILRAVGKNGKH